MMSKRQNRGFTLIEIIIFIVVVGAGLAGIMAVSTNVVRSSADPMLRKQAMSLADSILEEIMLQNFNDPDGLPNIKEGAHADWDNVSDYDGQNNATLGVPAALAAYAVDIRVANDTTVVGSVPRPALRVTVTVNYPSNPPESVAITGYRTCYGETDPATGLNSCP
jgi:MSHA pilin protein MshD